MPLGFKLIWSGLTMSDQAQLIYDSKKKSALLPDQEFCQAYNLRRQVKYHNNSPFRLLLGKSNKKVF